MLDAWKALWFLESRIYSRRFLVEGLGTVFLGLVLFTLFVLFQKATFASSLNSNYTIQAFVDTLVLVMVLTAYEAITNFYWQARYGHRMGALYLFGLRKGEGTIFWAETLIALLKSGVHVFLTALLLVLLTTTPQLRLNLQGTIVFALAGVLQVIVMSKILGACIRSRFIVQYFFLLVMFPLLLLSGLYLGRPGPIAKLGTLSQYLPPYNWLQGLHQTVLLGHIDYTILFICIVETAILLWIQRFLGILDENR